ncbi:copine-8-like [Poeciliopsis prolifica]|uniref:copine-8-like n=1 Tax=Poeciliopsis prolifica TaxID=188132 RepID=UPI0024133E7C|nr:copine-8-like [Poeciliopsis prolifica]
MNMASIGDADPFTAAIPATKVELTVSCRNLLDRDTFSKSDPICVLYTQGIANREWREFGRTEVIDNTLNPDFVRKFIVDYFFEERQNLRFDLYDLDCKSDNLSKHDFLGQAFCTLGEIVGSLGSRLEKPLIGIPGKKCGTIIIRAEELSNCRESVMLQFCGNKLDKKDFFGKSDPFLVFYRSNEDGSYTICHKTEVVKNTLDPVWQAFKIPVRALCNGDYDRSIKVEVYDWDRDGGHDFIGEFSTSYREMCRSQSQFHIYEVLNPKKKGKKKKKYQNSGTVTLLSCLVDTELSFLDYIRGGTQINFTVAIDFTASNGNPSQPTSLHYMSPYQLNDYAMALRAIGEIIQDYDSDKLFPALGFGAKLPPDGRVSHEFPLNGNPQNPYCSGIDGVMEAYYQSLKSVRLYGPTHFSPVINHVARYASAVTDGSQYFILLIISDGVITDMAQTKESIVNAASLPMSIIIVGVGPAEFDEMIELDGDEERISSQGRYAERDIVQFVPFRDYIDRRGNHILSMARLAKEVLAEIPDQFLSYMRTRGIKPGPQPPPYTPCPPPAVHPLHTRRGLFPSHRRQRCYAPPQTNPSPPEIFRPSAPPTSAPAGSGAPWGSGQIKMQQGLHPALLLASANIHWHRPLCTTASGNEDLQAQQSKTHTHTHTPLITESLAVSCDLQRRYFGENKSALQRHGCVLVTSLYLLLYSVQNVNVISFLVNKSCELY